MSILKVKWLDAVRDISGWLDIDEYDFESHEDSMLIETVGFFIKATDRAIFLAQTIGNNKVSGVICIPSGCILSIIKDKEISNG